MQQDQKTYLFETMPIPRAVATLCIPTILSSLVMVLYNLADTFFVGMLNDPVQNAAVTFAAPVLLAFNAVNNLFGVGTSSMMSRALGEKDHETVRRSSAFGFYCCVVCAILFSLLCTIGRAPLLRMLGTDPATTDATAGYLFWTASLGALPAILNVVMAYMVRAEGAALHASIGTMSGCILNMILDPFFILPWGLNMGAAGAGCATFLSNCVACCYFFCLLWKKRGNTLVCIRPDQFGFRRKITLGIFGVGIPSSIQNLLNVTGMTILNNFVAAYGADAVAAMGIAHKMNMIPLYICLGCSQGIMPLIGYTYASRNYKRMQKTFFFAISVCLSIITIAAAVMGWQAGAVISFFMDNPAIITHGQRFLSALSLSLPFMCIDFMIVGVFQAMGRGKTALLFAVLRKIVLEIPALFLLNLIYPLYGLGYAQLVAESALAVIAACILTSLLRRLTSGERR